MSKWVAGSRRVAALLAAWTVQPGAISLTASATGRKAASCSAEEVVAQLVGGGEVGPDAGQLEPLVVAAGAGQLDQRVRVALPEPAHAAVELDVDPGHPAEIGRHPRAELPEALAPDRDLGVRCEGDAELVLGEGAHHQDRRVGEVQPELLGLGRGGDREPGGPAAQRRGGAGRGAVAVAVRLDHGAELGPLPDPLLEGPAVSLDGPGVDDRERAARSVSAMLRAPAPPGSTR